ncbi:hypothetical protein AAFC00_005213 [Neodothiora populina]|uniref:Rhodopsin domain-containing protein n=1 Tax=Neodothiora populina TaxID=2781224 RepID=A0ABR3PK63_9PEZI
MGHYINGYYVFAPVTSTDHAGLLWVTSILSLLFSTVTLAARYHIRRRSFGIDDWLVSAAQFFALAQYIALFVGMDSRGLGKSSSLLTTDEAREAGRSVFASNCLFLISLAFTKFSIVVFMKRLFTRDFTAAWMACNILLGVVTVWAVGSMLALTVGCGPTTKLEGARCVGQTTRWGVVAGFDAMFEIAIVVLSVILVRPLQMGWDVKVTVVGAFSFRIVVALFAILHAVRVGRLADTPDPGLAIIGNLIWLQIELGYALMSATIPTLRGFIRGYEKAMGWEVSNTHSHSNKPELGMFGTASYQMHSLANSKNSRSGGRSTQDRSRHSTHLASADDDTIALGNDFIHGLDNGVAGKYKVNAYGPRPAEPGGPRLKREPSTGSSESQEAIIRKDVHFSISSEMAPTSPWPPRAGPAPRY